MSKDMKQDHNSEKAATPAQAPPVPAPVAASAIACAACPLRRCDLFTPVNEQELAFIESLKIAEVTRPAGLSVRQKLMLCIANDADGAEAGTMDEAHFSRAHAKRDVFAFFRDYFNRGSGRACNLSAFARLELDVVQVGTERNFAKRQRIAGTRVGSRT